VDGAWLAAFRVLYGLAMCVSMLRFTLYGWVDRLFVSPSFRFTYYGFDWVQPLPGPMIHALFWTLAALSACVALGLCFRAAAFAFALGLSYVLLLDVSTYLNHYYLAALLAWLLAVSPAHRVASIDGWLSRRWRGNAATDRPATVAAAWLYLFRFQVGVVYVFAGLAKAQSDWLVHAQPLRIWLGAKTSLPVLGSLFTIDWVPLAMSWAGFLFDTTIVLWLLNKRTRLAAYAVVVVFHVSTHLLFSIGMFPVIMTIAALMFFEPSWPRELWRRITRRATSAIQAAPPALPRAPIVRSTHVAAFALAACYCAVQLALPLRSYLYYGGNVLWHEQGMRFGWRVMLRAKGGSTELAVRNLRTGREVYVNPSAYLTGTQEAEMSSQPDLILQLAHHVRQDFERRGLGPVEVRAITHVSLNGRRAAPLIDPEIDLARVRDSSARAPWILPAPSEPPPHTRPVL
jgi:hypothetical protein